MIARKDTKPAARAEPVSFKALMARSSWRPLPSAAFLTGTADFLKGQFVKKFTRELFGESEPEVHRFQGPANDRQLADLPLAVVLDELRTASLFASPDHHRRPGRPLPRRPWRRPDVARGRLRRRALACPIDGKLDGRTRFAKAAARVAWVVDCPQPYDRPPPRDAKAPAWDSELTHWTNHASGRV
jgi:hypothetical protein